MNVSRSCDGVGFLGVSIVADERSVRNAAHRTGFDVPHAVTTGNLLVALDVDDVPATVMIRDGRIVGIAEGERDEAAFRRMCEALR